MNLLVSIFGGMLLTALLYAAGRTLRLSNFWAATAAAGLPSFAYLAYAVAAWPGLDVVTLHIVAYPTVALMLFQLYGAKAGQPGKLHWAPKLIIGFFVIITVLLGSFVHIASKGMPPALTQLLLPGAKGKNIHTGFAGVVAHGDDAAKGIGHHLKMDDKLGKLGWQLEVSGLDALKPGNAGEIRAWLRKSDGVGVPGIALTLGIGRPGQAPERALTFADAGDGVYRVQANLPARGAWLATLTLAAPGGPIVLEHEVGGE